MFTRCIKFMIMTPKELMIPFWGQQAFLVFGARGRHYESAGRWKDMCSAVFDLFLGVQTKHISKSFLRPTLGSSSNIDFFGAMESPGRCHSHLAIPFAHGLWNGLTYSCTTRWTFLHTLGTCGAMVHQGGLRKGDEMNWGQSKNHVPNRSLFKAFMFFSYIGSECKHVLPSPLSFEDDAIWSIWIFYCQYLYTYIHMHMFWWFWCEWLNHHLVTLEIYEIERSIFAWGSNHPRNDVWLYQKGLEIIKEMKCTSL